MSFEKTLYVTTVDECGTSRREDGFYIDRQEKIVYTVLYIPYLPLVDMKAVEQALRSRQNRTEKKLTYFKSHKALKAKRENDVIVFEYDFPYKRDQVLLGLGKAKIQTSFNFEKAQKKLGNNSQLSLLLSFSSRIGSEAKKPDELIATLSGLMNEAAAGFSERNKIPFLVVDDEGKISVGIGSGKINGPMRYATSLINCIQISSFLRDGKPAFSNLDLWKLIY